VFAAAETLNAVTAVMTGIWLGRRMKAPTTRTFVLASLALGVSLTWSAVSPGPAVFLVGMLYFGAAVVLYSTVSQALVQAATPPHLVGRIMTLYMMGLLATTPLGGLLAGWVTDAYSPRAAIGLGAASLYAVAIAVALAHRHPIATAPHAVVLVETPEVAAELPEAAG
jgi:MFS family permease